MCELLHTAQGAAGPTACQHFMAHHDCMRPWPVQGAVFTWFKASHMQVCMYLLLVFAECPHADDDGIFSAFSPAGAGLGIRSLPNALTPLYRQQLFQQLVHAGVYSNHRPTSMCAVGWHTCCSANTTWKQLCCNGSWLLHAACRRHCRSNCHAR
jgi:hypothetical protein